MIRRFRIHEFNIDAIIHAVLPYHETALFVTMISILQIEYVFAPCELSQDTCPNSVTNLLVVCFL